MDQKVGHVNVIAMIRKKTAAITKLRAQTRKLEAELDEIRELLDGAMEVSPTSSSPRSRRGRPTRAKAPSAPYLPGSSVGLTAELLREAGKPLHAADIIRELGRRGHAVKITTLVGNLARYVKNGRTFVRVAPNVFGLKGRDQEEPSG